MLRHGSIALQAQQPIQAYRDFEAASKILPTAGSDFLKPAGAALHLLTYSGLTNARLQLATHPKIKPEMKEPLLKSRNQHLKRAVMYHGRAKAVLSTMETKNKVDEMILEIDGLSIRAKKIEVGKMERMEVDEVVTKRLIGELEGARVKLKGLEEEYDVRGLVRRVDDQILILEELLKLEG
jgi:hypothetical protein